MRGRCVCGAVRAIGELISLCAWNLQGGEGEEGGEGAVLEGMQLPSNHEDPAFVLLHVSDAVLYSCTHKARRTRPSLTLRVLPRFVRNARRRRRSARLSRRVRPLSCQAPLAATVYSYMHTAKQAEIEAKRKAEQAARAKRA